MQNTRVLLLKFLAKNIVLEKRNRSW